MAGEVAEPYSPRLEDGCGLCGTGPEVSILTKTSRYAAAAARVLGDLDGALPCPGRVKVHGLEPARLCFANVLVAALRIVVEDAAHEPVAGHERHRIQGLVPDCIPAAVVLDGCPDAGANLQVSVAEFDKWIHLRVSCQSGQIQDSDGNHALSCKRMGGCRDES